MSNVYTKEQVLQAIARMAAAVSARKDYLTELDAAIGDADHGINLDRGFAAVRQKLALASDQDLGAALKTVGMTLVSTVGGASGPLYGSAFLYAGNAVAGRDELSWEDVVRMFSAAREAIVRRGGAQVGDKTMLDALAPVVEYLEGTLTGGPPPGVWECCADLAHQGQQATVPLLARKGRASFLKERSIGHPDPGATSCYYLIRAIAGGEESHE
ncbi:MAG TPA: dihydroxyacetone kinase subunit L [Firmicutes bacterium]|nr:dihydroxyacetone kinase subunit L [Bacillota bacterium]